MLGIEEVLHLPTALAVIALLLVIIITSQDPFDLEARPGARVLARITSLSVEGNKYQGQWPGLRVSAQTAKGARGVTTALPKDLRGFKIGDPIEADQQGIKLYLKPRPCR